MAGGYSVLITTETGAETHWGFVDAAGKLSVLKHPNYVVKTFEEPERLSDEIFTCEICRKAFVENGRPQGKPKPKSLIDKLENAVQNFDPSALGYGIVGLLNGKTDRKTAGKEKKTMEFKDIAKYTTEGNYDVHVSLRYLPQHIEEWTDDLKLDMNPDFQRGHVWTEAQQTAFVEHLLRGGKCPKVYFNHPGWFTNYEGDFVLVDGLQRTTAGLRFMRNELGVFGGYTASDFTENVPRDVRLEFNVHDLKTRAEVIRWYLQMNFAGTPHTPAELARVQALLNAERPQ